LLESTLSSSRIVDGISRQSNLLPRPFDELHGTLAAPVEFLLGLGRDRVCLGRQHESLRLLQRQIRVVQADIMRVDHSDDITQSQCGGHGKRQRSAAEGDPKHRRGNSCHDAPPAACLAANKRILKANRLSQMDELLRAVIQGRRK
jgi:hypothetical protein